MDKQKLLAIGFVFMIGMFVAVVYTKSNSQNQTTEITPVVATPTPEKEIENDKEYTAHFEIYTNGTKRIFSQSMYMEQSPKVYIPTDDSTAVVVKGKNVTWSDFFATLPMSLSSDCLVTGTGQKFCETVTKKLTFYINDVETPNALNSVIAQDSTLKVVYE